jgi:uncharacterized protein VirK/YbjX
MKYLALLAAFSSVNVSSGSIGALRMRRLAQSIRRLLRIVFVRSWILLYHFTGHLRLTSILLSTDLIELTQRHPKLTFKYLGGNYLARCLSAKARLAILTHHYGFLRRCLKTGFPKQLCDVRPVLWQAAIDDAQIDIRLSFPYSLHHPNRTVDYEGDFAVTLYLDSAPLYVMCMTIAPARIVKTPLSGGDNGHALFVARIQGTDGRFEQIRRATKLMHDISPKDILFAAAQGIAAAIDAGVVIGVSTEEHLFRPEDGKEEGPFFDYDKFWETLGARRTEDNLFVLTLPPEEKPIETIAQKHKARTLRKRAFKKQVCADMCERFGTQFLAMPSATAAVRVPAENRAAA